MPTSQFSAGAVFELQDRFSANLDKLTGGLTLADDKLKALMKSAGMFGTTFSDSTKKALDSLNTLSAGVTDKSRVMGGAMDSAFAGWGKAAGAASDKVLASVGEMQKGVLLDFDAIKASGATIFDGLSAGAATGAAGIASALKPADDAIAGLMGRVGALKAEMETLGAGMKLPSVVPGLPNLPQGPREDAHLGHRRGGGGMHFGRVGGEIGGVHASISGNAGFALAGLALDGVYEAAQIDDAVAKALAASEIPFGREVSKEGAGKHIHDMIQSMSKQTGFSFHESGEAILDSQRLLSGLDFNTRNNLVETIMPFAATEAIQKGSSLKEATEAIIGIAHQVQTYDPAGIASIAKNLAFTSMLTPSALPQFKNALGYSLPELHNGLGMDMGTISLLTASMQQSGISGTKSGTWLRSFFENSEPGSDEHNEALRKLGMLGADNKPTWRKTGADGKVDWASSIADLSGILRRDAETIPIDDRLNLLRKAYGERGAGFASLMMGQKFTENLSAAEKGMANFKGGQDFLKQYADVSILQQGKLALQEFNVAMSDLGTHLMPAATQAVKDFSAIVKAFDSDSPLKNLGKEFWNNAIRPDLPSFLGGPTTKDPNGKDHHIYNNAQEWQGFSPMAYVTGDDTRAKLLGGSFGPLSGGGSNDNDPGVQMVRRGVFLAFGDYASGGSGGVAGLGGGGSGGGLINASYETPDAGFISRYAHGPAGSGVGHVFSAADREKNIRTYATSIGINPDVAMAVSRSEGFAKFTGDYGSSHGDFQMHEAANIPGQRSGGLGDLFRREKHLDPANPRNELALDRFALDQAKKGGWGPWHGAAHIGIHGMYGIGRAPEHMPTVEAPRPKVSPGRPAAMTTAMNLPPIQVNLTHVLDGKVLSRTVTKHLAAGMRFPDSMGGPDTHGTYVSPGTPLTDAA